MVGLPWYAFYPAQYRDKTNGLSMTQDGAYRRLMDEYYLTGEPLPPSADVLLRICRAFSDEERAAVTYVLSKYFVEGDDGWHHIRIDEEIVKRAELSQKRSEAGSKGASKTNSKLPPTLSANDQQVPTHLHKQPQERKKKELSASRFEDFWAVSPKKEGRGDAEKAWAKALRFAEADVLIAAMVRYAETQIGKDRTFIKTPAPWLNSKKWLDEGIAPANMGATEKAVHPSWNGHEAPLRAAIGNPNFEAYFAGHPIEGDVFFAPTALVKELIERKFSSHLHALGISVEVRG